MECLPCCGGSESRPGTFGWCSVFSLVAEYPALIDGNSVLHFGTVVAMMQRTQVAPFRQLLKRVPVAVFQRALTTYLQEVDRKRLVELFPALCNDAGLVESLAVVQINIEPAYMVEVIKHARPSAVKALLRIAPEILAKLTESLDPQRFQLLVPMTQEGDHLINDTLVPFITSVEHLERVAAVANTVDPGTLIAILRGVSPERLAAVIDGLGPANFEPGGTAITVLRMSADPEFVSDKLVPLFERAPVQRLLPVVDGVRPKALMDVLQRVEVEGLLRLIENTDPAITVRLLNGPLEPAVSAMSGRVADLLSNRGAASAVRNTSEAVAESLAAMDVVREGLHLGVKEILARGKESRGGTEEEGGYKFGDITRGIWATAMGDDSVAAPVSASSAAPPQEEADMQLGTSQQAADSLGSGGALTSMRQRVLELGKERRGATVDDEYRIGDFTRGLIASVTAGGDDKPGAGQD